MNQNWPPFGINPRLKRLRQKLSSDPYYRLQSEEEILMAAHLGVRIDVNRAAVDDWLRLPGLSIHQARNLVELSRVGVRFYCIEDMAAALSLSAHRLKSLEVILNFSYYEDENIEGLVHVVDPNTATLESLLRVPCIDVELAQALIDNRFTNGLYRNLADFQQRLNLSSDVIAKLMYHLRFQT